MNELDSARMIIRLLDERAESLPESILIKIEKIRGRALAQRRESSAYDPFKKPVGWVEHLLHFVYSGGGVLRNIALIAVFCLGTAFAFYLNSEQEISEMAEVDSALLTDVLPIDAFIDRGFDAWLKNTSVL